MSGMLIRLPGDNTRPLSKVNLKCMKKVIVIFDTGLTSFAGTHLPSQLEVIKRWHYPHSHQEGWSLVIFFATENL